MDSSNLKLSDAVIAEIGEAKARADEERENSESGLDVQTQWSSWTRSG